MDDSKGHQGLNRRVAIVGAGAAGLSAAHALRALGYENVVVFERADRVGGKCHTIEIDGRNYELGAGIVAEDNEIVLRLAKEFGVRLERLAFGRSAEVDGETGDRIPERTARETFALAVELLRYRRLSWKYRSAGEPGLGRVYADLTVSFAEFARAHRIERLAAEFALFFTGFGYGYFERVPAAYVLKYYRWPTLVAFLQRKIYRLPGGIQHLWTAVAAAQDVRLSTTITKIERGEIVRVTTEAGTEEFDALLIASPLDETVSYLDATDEERALFSRIQYVDYVTIACHVTGIADGDGYVPSNYLPSRPGTPLFWHHRHPDADVYTFYALADGTQSDDDLVRGIGDLVKQMNGALGAVHGVTHWKYFPHVSTETMRSGFFDRVDALQGSRQTYYVGESLNFSTVGFASEHADATVNRFFTPRP